MPQLIELGTKAEMLEQLSIIQQLYPDYTLEIYGNLFRQNDSAQLQTINCSGKRNHDGFSRFWIATKLWSGKYLEMDNVVVHEDFRSKGIGSIMTEYLNQKAIDEDCNMIVLDAYTTNFGAQKFYMNHGFVPKGFHFVKYLKD